MSGAEYFRELALPFRSLPVLLTILSILAVTGVVHAFAFVNPFVAIGLALVFGFFLLPGVMRYLVYLAENRAKGVDVEPPTAEMFGFIGNVWALFPGLVPIAFAVWLLQAADRLGVMVSTLLALLFVAVYPAMIGVLVVTASVLRSVNPFAISTIVKRIGPSYTLGPLTALGGLALSYGLGRAAPALAVAVGVYSVFALFAVTGALLRAGALLEAAEIPAPVEPAAGKQTAQVEQRRMTVLNHAYGFFTRGNRDGGLKHIEQWLEEEPDPAAAWPWFLEQMFTWEQQQHALHFAQRYLTQLLSADERVAAVKLLLRCQLVEPGFKPLAKDLPAAIEAAETSGNDELAVRLRRL